MNEPLSSNLEVVRDEMNVRGEISEASARVLFAEIERLTRDNEALTAQRNRANLKVAKLRAALERYGAHDDYDACQRGQVCVCGLNEALRGDRPKDRPADETSVRFPMAGAQAATAAHTSETFGVPDNKVSGGRICLICHNFWPDSEVLCPGCLKALSPEKTEGSHG